MSSAHQSYLSRKYFPGLNGLRAIAIVAVVWHHCARPDFLPIFNRGFLGVDLFFVLSGFLISTLLLREKARNGRISLKDFWLRRILRLVPAYYLLLFSLLVVYLIFKPGDPNTQNLVGGLPVYALYFSNWIHPGANNLGITWSLATEEQFYLIWPLFEAFAAPVISTGFWVAALIVNQLINFGVLDPTLSSVFGVTAYDHPEILETTFTPILLGVGLAHFLNREKGYAFAQKIAGFAYAPFVFAALLFLTLNIPASDISGVMRLAIHLLMALWLTSVIVKPASTVTRFLDWRPVEFVGAVSYGMYLYHMWCIHIARVLIEKIGAPQIYFQFVLALAGTIALSAASYYIVEKRFLNLRKKFRP